MTWIILSLKLVNISSKTNYFTSVVLPTRRSNGNGDLIKDKRRMHVVYLGRMFGGEVDEDGEGDKAREGL